MSAAGAVIIIDVVGKNGVNYQVSVNCRNDAEKDPKLLTQLLRSALTQEKAKRGNG